MWSMWSTRMPVTCCMLQRFGSGFGQNGSTLKIGAPFSSTACPGACACTRSPQADGERQDAAHDENHRKGTLVHSHSCLSAVADYLLH